VERIPILKMGGFLLVTIQVDMHDRLALALQDDLTDLIVKHRSRGVLIDISTLEMVDSFIGRMLGTIASMASLLDAATVVVGMQPSVAITLVELGFRSRASAPRSMWRKAWPLCNRYSPPAERTGMKVLSSESMPVRSSEDVVIVRQAVRKKAIALGFGLVDQTKFVTASSELARNTLDYGGGGTVQLDVVQNDRRSGLRLIFEDQGPGIPDIEIALTDGFTSGSGMGLGLGGAKRLSNEFEIWSKPGEGTKVSILRWK
jgi:serine/threonine-protein kinase RsbT